MAFLDRVDDHEAFGAPVCGDVSGPTLVEATRALVGRLRALRAAGIRAHSAFIVLHCYAQGCCTHLQRAHYERGGWLGALDDELFAGLSELVGGGLPQRQRALAPLRLTDGGLAFAELRQCSAVAYLGSWALVLPHVAPFLGATAWEGFSTFCLGVAGIACNFHPTAFRVVSFPYSCRVIHICAAIVVDSCRREWS